MSVLTKFSLKINQLVGGLVLEVIEANPSQTKLGSNVSFKIIQRREMKC